MSTDADIQAQIVAELNAWLEEQLARAAGLLYQLRRHANLAQQRQIDILLASRKSEVKDGGQQH